MRSILKKGALGAPVLVLAVLAPLRFAPDEGLITVNGVCADELCCVEIGSICGVLEHYVPHHYRDGNGSCPEG